MTVPLVLVHDPSPIFDYIAERGIVEAAGARLVVPATDAERDALLPEAAVVLVTGHQSFTAEHVRVATRCVGIQTASVGTDSVSADAAARGIEVRSAGGYCTTEVADHALALLLALERRLPAVDRATRRGEAPGRVPELRTIRRLGGRVLGLIGLGRIGQQVAVRAAAFGYRVLAVDPYGAPSPHAELAELPRMLAEADVIVSCAPLTPETAHLLDAAAFARMRDGVLLVNVSRGGLVREEDLLAALETGKVAAAALDVRDAPVPDPDPFRDRDDVLLTPHMGATSVDAVEELHRVTAEGCVAMLEAAGLLAAGGRRG